MTYKVKEILFIDLKMAQSLEKALQELTNEGYQVHSIQTTFSSVLVVANKVELVPGLKSGNKYAGDTAI